MTRTPICFSLDVAIKVIVKALVEGGIKNAWRSEVSTTARESSNLDYYARRPADSMSTPRGQVTT
jgi:ketol-acid reductoisomerase